ncbi:hypothetical protein SAMN05428967_0769 [Phyllobacterium sp. YR620]|uniref:hypothetical protein n=1 Tax=Phyllobacterium sp. YR620 TaxID=1881066 RepID=UPI00088D6B66|nr:hypothetical protein [Phyllobacterium sp. YR620]SDO98192.1 hypothetical protein SAMN05428967_0769 [Phyllobacterium sp. YR620]
MSTCDELYHRNASVAERLASFATDQLHRWAEGMNYARQLIARRRRLRETELALDSLPDSIRCDIGWPDLYERQIRDYNEIKPTRR